jgi:hypothetical protein
VKEVDAPAVYLSPRFWTDFGAASLICWLLAAFFGVPAAPLVALFVGGISAIQAQRPRVRDEIQWARAVLASARERELLEARSSGDTTPGPTASGLDYEEHGAL